MKLQTFFQKNWIHFAVIAFIMILSAIYFKPQMDGYGLKQHDMEQWKGMANETHKFRENTGEEALWTNSLFGGMPTTQISVLYKGNLFKQISNQYFITFPGPIGLLILHLIGFYILSLFLRMNPLVGVFGAIAFSFASYEIIIMQAGHMTKSMATAFMAPTLGAFIFAYREKRWLGVLFASLFMTLELAMNHVQVTYYFIFLLGFVGLYFLFEAIKTKTLKPFIITSSALIGGFVLAFLINIGNIALTSEYAKNTIRGGNDITIQPNGLPVKNASKGLDKDYITNWSYGKGETFTLISPNVKGGGSFALGDSQFDEIVENSDLNASDKDAVRRYPAYWGEQPFTSGPVYLGAVVMLLAVLGLIFLKTKLKWALFLTTVLCILLSWGKNFMGLTDFFIDHFPGYNKFRTVTIILVVVELCIPLLGMLFLDQILKQRQNLLDKKKQFLIAIGSFIAILVIIKLIGLGDNYIAQRENEQMSGIETNIRSQIQSIDPQVLIQQYNLDISNQGQLDEFVRQQAEQQYAGYDNLKLIRKDIFNSSMNRSILFVILGGILVLLFIYTSLPNGVILAGIILVTMLDIIPIAHQYLGNQEVNGELKYWQDKGISDYPIASNTADYQILESELNANPSLKSIIEKAEKEGKEKADELGYSGTAKKNVIDSYKFSALNFHTNYRVFDLNGGFSSCRASYFHKSLGGYHGAKLRNINNLFDFHLSKMNNKVYDMLNVKYFLQSTETGDVMRPNPTAMGNAWLVKEIKTFDTPNDEIRALGSQFELENKAEGQLLVNYEAVKKTQVYGSEKIQYLIPGKDTLVVNLSNGMPKNMEAYYVIDSKGVANFIPVQSLNDSTAKSFQTLAKLKVINTFEPHQEAVMLKSEAAKLTQQKYSGQGTVKFTKYAPNNMEYKAELEGKQLIVFSEVYYKDGWKAFVDGKETPILKVNYLLRGLEVEGGKHSIVMKFDSPTFWKANKIAAVSSILLILGFFVYGVSWFKNRKNRTVTSQE